MEIKTTDEQIQDIFIKNKEALFEAGDRFFALERAIQEDDEKWVRVSDVKNLLTEMSNDLNDPDCFMSEKEKKIAKLILSAIKNELSQSNDDGFAQARVEVNPVVSLNEKSSIDKGLEGSIPNSTVNSGKTIESKDSKPSNIHPMGVPLGLPKSGITLEPASKTPICKCGHNKDMHAIPTRGASLCNHIDETKKHYCSCKRYVEVQK